MTLPTEHPFQHHLANVARHRQNNPHKRWTPADGPMPTLFVSHGAPHVFENPSWMAEWYAWAGSLPRPTAILVVPAHWEDAPIALSASAACTPLVYDFGGFDPLYHQMRYETPDASNLATETEIALGDLGPVLHLNSRGLDHGAWVPLKVMYPAGDIPVLLLSMPTLDPDRLLKLGRRLRALRDQGVLIIGSGQLTHGLRHITPAMIRGAVPGWSRDFDSWATEALSRGDVDELAAFTTRAPGMPYAHPTVEHFTPRFVTLGAATNPETPIETTTVAGYSIGMSTRSFQAA